MAASNRCWPLRVPSCPPRKFSWLMNPLGLAPILVSHTIAKIKELKEQYQLTVLMAEQNFHQAVKIADRGYIIVHGRIAFEGRSTQELSENALVKQYYLGV